MVKPPYIPDDVSGNAEIAKEGYYDRARKTNQMQLKLREMIQKDEQKSINKHSEGYCYGCTRKDFILSTLIYACRYCMAKRGKECLLNIVYHKPGDEMCDLCGRWQRPFDTFQINCSMCNSCMQKLIQFHQKYRKDGGRDANPFYKKLRRKYGKDWKILSGFTPRRLKI